MSRYLRHGLLWALLLGSVLVHAMDPSPIYGSLCENSARQVFTPSRAPRMPDDPLMRLVLTTEALESLRDAMKTSDVNARRGTTGTTLLALAASVGNLNAIRVLLENKAQRELPTANGDTPLEAAIMNGRAAAACLLMQSGAVLPAPGKKPYLVPTAALGEDFAAALSLVDLLARAGFDLDARTQGDTALHIATELGNTALVKFLIEKRADLAARNARGETPLSVAQRAGQREIAQLLRSARKAK